MSKQRRRRPMIRCELVERCPNIGGGAFEDSGEQARLGAEVLKYNGLGDADAGGYIGNLACPVAHFGEYLSCRAHDDRPAFRRGQPGPTWRGPGCVAVDVGHGPPLAM